MHLRQNVNAHKNQNARSKRVSIFFLPELANLLGCNEKPIHFMEDFPVHILHFTGHINNQHATCVHELVKNGKTVREAQEFLKVRADFLLFKISFYTY